jgi:membrane-anchored mycosin MYCP
VPAIWRTHRQRLTGIASVFLAVVAFVTAFAVVGCAAASAAVTATSAAGPSYVKYYVVAASYQGKPENLAEIAERFLGSADRSQQIFQLNEGASQPGGGRLTDPSASLPAGWVLVLPWDAVGPGVQYGLLPTAPPAAGAPTGPVTAQAPATRARHAPAAKHAQGSAGPCAGTPGSTGNSQDQWAMPRVAPQQAWPYSRGAGVTVAIVDSGVDASLPQLAGRVTAGGVIGGTGGGNTDCLGSGTAMAAIVAARSGAAVGTTGMAPDATIMPVRVAPTKAAAVSAADQARAVAMAVSAGAKVVALGGYINPALPTVAKAIELAASHDVVVVAEAPARSQGTAAAPGSVPAAPGVIRVGAINIDGSVTTNYQPDSVDVVAPGAAVAGLGVTGTGQLEGSGTQYAVAFVAGEAALVRARYPDLTAAQVVRQIEAAADPMDSAKPPDSAFGWGLIDPGKAVARLVADERPGPRPAIAASGPGRGWSSPRTKALAITVLLALIVVLLLALRIRRIVLPAVSGDADWSAAPESPSAAMAGGPPGGGGGLPALNSERAFVTSAAAHSDGARLAAGGWDSTGSAGRAGAARAKNRRTGLHRKSDGPARPASASAVPASAEPGDPMLGDPMLGDALPLEPLPGEPPPGSPGWAKT